MSDAPAFRTNATHMIITSQSDMAVQDDLSSLFSKNLTLAPRPQPAPPQDDKVIYISQHYNHSAHVAAQQQQQQQVRAHQDEPMPRPSSEPPPSDLQDLEMFLHSHGVNTSALTWPQVELFRSAADPQKARLLQLWTICPLSKPDDTTSLIWSKVTLELEEMRAQRRLEHQRQQHQQHQQHQQQHPLDETIMSLDGTDTGITTSMQSADSRWAARPHHCVEPYMQSGYDQLAMKEYNASVGGGEGYRAATDPVYQASGAMGGFERQQQWAPQHRSAVGGCAPDEEMS